MVRMLLLSLLLIGCSKIDNRPAKKGMQWFPQTCLKCGSTFDVCPAGPEQKVSPTVEWCFNDGAYCEAGFVLVQDVVSKHPSYGSRAQFIKHCRACDGCKCAAYSPEQWHALMNALNVGESE